MSHTEAPRAERVYLSLVSEHQTAILNYLYRLVGDADTAEDLTQETYVKAWRALERLELGEEAAARRRAWLYRIAHNTALDHLRRKTRFRWLGLDALRGGEGDPAGQVVDGAPVRQALRRLGEDHRQVLLLFNQEGMSSEEVSEVLGISPAAARKRRQRARDAFREIYDALEAGPGREAAKGGEDEDSDGDSDGDGRGDGRGGDRPDGGASAGTGNRGRVGDGPTAASADWKESAEDRTHGTTGTPGVNCSRLRDRLELGPLGAMGATERAELEAHASDCADCRRLLESEAWIDAAFDGGRRLSPSRALQRALLEVPRRDRRARWLVPLVLPLAMAFCALGSWMVWTLAPDSGQRAETAGTATVAVLGSADATGTAAAESQASPVADGLEMQRRRETVEAAGTATAGALSGLPPATASVVAATLVAEATEALARPSGSSTPPLAATRLAIAPDPTRRPGASGADPGPRRPQPSGTPEVLPPGIGSATEEPTPASGATQSLVPAPTATPTGDAQDPALPTGTAQATPTEDPGGGRIATGTVRPPTSTATPDPELPPGPPPSRTPAGTLPPPITRTPSAPTALPTASPSPAPALPSSTPGMPPPTPLPATPTAGPAPTDEPTVIASATSSATATVTATMTITPTLTATPTPGLGLEPRLERGRAGRSVASGGSGGLSSVQARQAGSRACVAGQFDVAPARHGPAGRAAGYAHRAFPVAQADVQLLVGQEGLDVELQIRCWDG